MIFMSFSIFGGKSLPSGSVVQKNKNSSTHCYFFSWSTVQNIGNENDENYKGRYNISVSTLFLCKTLQKWKKVNTHNLSEKLEGISENSDKIET